MQRRRGRAGEAAAREALEQKGLRFLAANLRVARSELDLVFRDGECLVFVEVKARAADGWSRPARAVDARKRRLLSQAALAYVRKLEEPRVRMRFDIVEVLLEGDVVVQVRHLPAAFALSRPYQYG